MGIEENKKLALDYYRCVSAGDMDGAGHLLAEDSRLWIAGEGHWPLGGEHNIESLRRIWQVGRERFPGGLKMEVVGMTGEGDRVAVEALLTGRRVDGRFYANAYHVLFLMKDGKIVRRHEYLDVLHANDLLCGPLGEVGSMPQSMTHRP